MARVERIVNLTRGTELGGKVRRADNPWTRLVGLLAQKGLQPGEGLHIVPCASVHMFGMRFALDIVYLDANLRVVKTVPNLRPWRLSVAHGARTTLELPAGTIAHTRTVVGDQIAVTQVPL